MRLIIALMMALPILAPLAPASAADLSCSRVTSSTTGSPRRHLGRSEPWSRRAERPARKEYFHSSSPYRRCQRASSPCATTAPSGRDAGGVTPS
jgi:hypothetical protein